MEPWSAMARKKNIPAIPFMKSLCIEGWWCSCSTFVNFPGPGFNGRVELCTATTLDKSISREEIRALCHHLWLKLPEVFPSHSLAPTLISRIIQEKRRGKAEQNKLSLAIISEFLA